MPGARSKRPPQPPRKRTIQLRDFRGGINLTDSRISIADNELAWGENCLPVGAGQLQILNGPGDAVYTYATGISWLFGCVLSGIPVNIVVGTDGSLTQVTPGGVALTFGPAGTVTGTAGTCSFAIWQGTTLLILDPTTGYRSWDGAALVLVDATMKGNALAVFQGRAWIFNGRNIISTAPNSFTNFAPGFGATNTVLADEAFPGNIVNAVSAFEQLWLIGAGAIDTISNVQTVLGVTTSAITNIITNLGTTAKDSVLGYLRALTFLCPSGAYGVSGVTPQKISEKLDGLFPELTISSASVSSAVAIVQNLTCLLFRVLYTGTKAQAGTGPIPLILIFANGKWSFAHQGNAQWITTLLVDGVAQCWATDGVGVYQLFAGTGDVTWKAQWKLSDFGASTRVKHVLKSGLEFQATTTVVPHMTIDNETSETEAQDLETEIPLTLVNNAGDVLTAVNDAGEVQQMFAQGEVLSRQRANMYGNFIGWTLFGTTSPKLLIQTVLLQIQEGPDKWLTPATSAGRT